MRVSGQKNLWLFIGISTLIHLALLGLWIALPSFSAHKLFNSPPISAKLVKLGKERDKKLLPRKEKPVLKKKPEEHQIKKKVINQGKQPVKKIVKKSEPKKKEPAKQTIEKSLSKALTALSNDGRREGSEFGEALDGDLADSYNNKIQAMIKEAYKIPAILKKGDLDKLSVSIVLKIDSSGKPLAVSVIKPSGNGVYDHSVLSGARSINSFGAPPLLLRRKYASKGILVKLCPISCRD